MSTGAQDKAGRSRRGPHSDGPRLLADIGGTNARFALEWEQGDIRSVRVYPCANFPGIVDVIRKYLADEQVARCAACRDCDRQSGRWRSGADDQSRLAVFDRGDAARGGLRHAAGGQRFHRAGHGFAGAHRYSKRAQVGAGTRRPNTVIGLVGPGTGLGVSGLVPMGDRWFPLHSEGGHASFSPTDEREDYVLGYARKQWPHVSFERVVSGPGITLIYRALVQRNQERQEHQPLDVVERDTPAVVELALAGDPLAHETLDCFCAMLGTFAGNVGVTLGAMGGVYIGGGVVPRLGDFFAQSSFRRCFEAKGRFEGYLKQVPTYVITAEYPAFLGVAAILADQIG